MDRLHKDRKEILISYRTDSELSSLSDPTHSDRFAFVRNFYAKTNDWRFGVLTCAISTFIVFLINLVVTIWAGIHYGNSDGQQILFKGDCDRAGNINTALHLFINVLSTILLSSSNYCMQCLSAPTRKDVDKAHAKGEWLDIGILSTRNLWGISGKRALMWWILALSSLPLHLFYNSVVFPSIMSNRTKPIQVTTAFVDSLTASYTGCNDNTTVPSYDISYGRARCNEVYDEAYRLRNMKANSLERLDNLACINAYSDQFQTKGNVLLVIDNSTSSKHILDSQAWNAPCGTPYSDRWVCDCYGYNDDRPCELDPKLKDLQSDPQRWAPFRSHVSYCLSEIVPQECKIQSSLHLAIVVIILNFVKAAVMYILATNTTEAPFLTVGDAVASYIDQPDISTRDMCFATRSKLRKQKGFWVKGSTPLSRGNQRLFVVISTLRWLFCLLMYVLVLCTIGGLLARGVFVIRTQYDGGWDFIKKLGVGKASTVTTIVYNVPSNGVSGLISNVLVANVAQPILSFMYFMYNGLFTAMSGAMEWESYIQNRKGLRVSTLARGHQRSTYFLTLPYKFGIPLMAWSAVVHWLVSQSIFLVNIDYREYESYLNAWVNVDSEFSCGYSPLAIILTLIAGGLMVMVIVGFGMIRLKSNMPVVANCSAAIAAACHMPVEDFEKGLSCEKLQWGVTGYDKDGIGHCSFSALPVDSPEEDRRYR